ncbi:tetraacyldisaccharide 4'-kinase [bacterium]|nr:tetraacyldisaccharide 4'-kinase [bacterium]
MAVPVSAIVHLRRVLYRSGILKTHRVGARVISVGNISMGGTGKTPLVNLLADNLAGRGIGVAILTRGYGRTSRGHRVLVGGNGKWQDVGDEPLMMSRSLPEVPVVVCADRIAGGRVAVEMFRPRILILDDGFQHLRLAREVELVVIDATCPFGNGRVFPAGILREKVKALRWAQLFVLTRVNQADGVGELVDFLHQICPNAIVVQSECEPMSLRDVHSGEQLDLEFLRGKQVLAMSGIGNPSSFERSLEQTGVRLIERVRFPDHHPYRREELEQVICLAREIGAQYVVTTEKDEVRLPVMGKEAIPLLSFGIRLRVISGERELWELVERGL